MNGYHVSINWFVLNKKYIGTSLSCKSHPCLFYILKLVTFILLLCYTYPYAPLGGRKEVTRDRIHTRNFVIYLCHICTFNSYYTQNVRVNDNLFRVNIPLYSFCNSESETYNTIYQYRPYIESKFNWYRFDLS